VTDILGDEGYCRHCRFIVSLDGDGRMTYHGIREGGGACKGSRLSPEKRTPYSSRKSRFSTEPPMVACPTCAERVALMPDGHLSRHTPSDKVANLCVGSYQTYEKQMAIQLRDAERDHRDRG